jgi:hypothetical protein
MKRNDIPPELLEAAASIPAREELPQEDPNFEEILQQLGLEEKSSFNKNIVDTIPPQVRDRIASYLKLVTEEDIKARQPWLDLIKKVKPYLGFEIEEFSKDMDSNIVNAQVKTYDTTFSTAILRLWAMIRSELLPSNGPVGFKTNIENAEEFELKGEMIKDSLNEYLTTKDKGFYPDYDRFLLYLLLYGCVFRKIYYDSNTNSPLSRFILPEDFLVDNNCSSILESNRLTHIRKLSKREIILNMQSGVFRSMNFEYLNKKNDLKDELEEKSEDKKDNAYSNTSRYAFYETHEYLDLKEFFDTDITELDFELDELPSPYIITRCSITNEIVSIVPNWIENDPTRTRINYFIHYNLFPGFDIYGLGLAQVLGSNAMSLTKMQRMAIDAAIFQNFPGGVKAPGIKATNNDMLITPGQWLTLDTGEIPLQQAIMPLPYNGPSPALLELSQRLITQTQQLASTTEVGISENGENTPVGTTIAMLEVANRMQSAILRTIHASFSDEIQLLYGMLNPLEANNDNLSIIPVSDPSIESTTQRIMKAESLLKIASTDPQLHNMPEVYTRVYKALGISNIEGVLKSTEQLNQQSQNPQPMDPAQVEMADIQQRTLEVESRERIAHLNIEADGYKTQMNIELEKQRMEQEIYIAELKTNQAEIIAQNKAQIELLKVELSEKENAAMLSKQELELKAKVDIELLKVEASEREVNLKAEIEILKEQIKTNSGVQYG